MQYRFWACASLYLIGATGLNAHNCPHFGKVLLEHASEKHESHAPKAVQVEQKQAPAALPETFGRTHFIVGASTSEVQQELQQAPATNAVAPASTPMVSNSNMGGQAYFSPDDGLEKKLIELINQEQESMKMAVFLFTNGDIAQALIEAQKRGVAIELITDASCLQDKFNKIKMLHDAGIKIRIYKPEGAVTIFGNRMHHKYIVFGKNKDGKSWLWFGSFNLTKSADLYNQEGVVLVDNSQLIDQFTKQFDLLKTRSVNYREIMSAFSVAAAERSKVCKQIKKVPKKTRSNHNLYVTV